MTGWVGDVGGTAEGNTYFREVLYTGKDMQLVVMSLRPGEEIGIESHDRVEQFVRVEHGRARVAMGPAKDKITETRDLERGSGVVVPADVWHNVVNTGDGELKLFTIYAPPEHPHGTVHKTKADAESD
jgi:mannose-6-phosphate isomerase-like protein (cupin superfamily)